MRAARLAAYFGGMAAAAILCTHCGEWVDPPGRQSTAPAVIFAGSAVADRALLVDVARRFYARHADAYDMLVIWAGPEFGPGHSFYLPVRNDTAGLGYQHFGREFFDDSAGFGSSRLQGVIWMGPTWRDDTGPQDASSTLGTLAHETAHRWAASVHFLNGGKPSSALLSGTAHWSFFLQTDGSPLGGNNWRGLGESHFRATPVSEVVFSELELYLMGLMAPEEVQPVLLLRNPRTADGRADTRFRPDSARIAAETIVIADAAYVELSQIIAVEGLRDPGTRFSAGNIQQAWIYVAKEGGQIHQGDLQMLGSLGQRWPAFFHAATHGLGSVELGP
jgi:hypothetical protein